jgi:hypothetical protein
MGIETACATSKKLLLNQPANRTMERETGIEPASLAWKARVLPLNYSRTANLPLALRPQPPRACRNLLSSASTGGGDWIRTSVGVSQQIYSLPPLATRAPLRRISNYSTGFLRFRENSHEKPNTTFRPGRHALPPMHALAVATRDCDSMPAANAPATQSCMCTKK